MLKQLVVVSLALALPVSATPLAAKRAQRSAIEGTWKTDCLPIGKNGRHGIVTRLAVKGKALTATSQVYVHNTCDTATVSTAYRGTIVATATDDDGALQFDHVVTAITMTADADDVVATYNASEASGCGMGGGWKKGVARGVEGRTCAPFSYPAVGTRLYESAWFSGNEMRIGSFPAVWTNTSPDKRPCAPGLMVFHRQSVGREK